MSQCIHGVPLFDHCERCHPTVTANPDFGKAVSAECQRDLDAIDSNRRNAIANAERAIAGEEVKALRSLIASRDAEIAKLNGLYQHDTALLDICNREIEVLRAQLANRDREDRRAQNLAMMLRRFIWQAGHRSGDESLKTIAGKALELLRQYGLEGSPLRNTPANDASGTSQPNPPEAQTRDGEG